MHFLEPLLDRAMTSPALWIEGREAPLATSVESAFDSASRKKGLLGRDGMPDAAALVIAPCNAIHTFAMRFPIDVIYVRRDGRIIKLRPRMKAARVSAALGAFAVIEMAAGSIDRANITVGNTLVVRPPV